MLSSGIAGGSITIHGGYPAVAWRQMGIASLARIHLEMRAWMQLVLAAIGRFLGKPGSEFCITELGASRWLNVFT